MQRIILAATLLALSACATIVEGSTDTVNVVTSPPANATCNLANNRGAYSTVAPTPATVKKSISDLNVSCVDAMGNRGNSVLASEVEPWDFGNILIGGLIGMGIDWGTGAAYNYPDSVVINMNAPTAPAPASMIETQPQAQPQVIAPVTQPQAQAAPAAEPRPVQDSVPATTSTIPAQTYYFNPARAGASGY